MNEKLPESTEIPFETMGEIIQELKRRFESIDLIPLIDTERLVKRRDLYGNEILTLYLSPALEVFSDPQSNKLLSAIPRESNPKEWTVLENFVYTLLNNDWSDLMHVLFYDEKGIKTRVFKNILAITMDFIKKDLNFNIDEDENLEKFRERCEDCKIYNRISDLKEKSAFKFDIYLASEFLESILFLKKHFSASYKWDTDEIDANLEIIHQFLHNHSKYESCNPILRKLQSEKNNIAEKGRKEMLEWLENIINIGAIKPVPDYYDKVVAKAKEIAEKDNIKLCIYSDPYKFIHSPGEIVTRINKDGEITKDFSQTVAVYYPVYDIEARLVFKELFFVPK